MTLQLFHPGDNAERLTGAQSLLSRSIRRIWVFSLVSCADSPWAMAVILILISTVQVRERGVRTSLAQQRL